MCTTSSKSIVRNFHKPFKFKNSLSKYIEYLYGSKKLNYIDSFITTDNKLIICMENNKDTCKSINTYEGKWNVYNLEDLNNLIWKKDVVNAHHLLVVSSYNKYNDINTLSESLITKISNIKDPAYMDYLENYWITYPNTKYIILPNAVCFFVHENRPRPYIYGCNKNGIIVAILLHSLI